MPSLSNNSDDKGSSSKNSPSSSSSSSSSGSRSQSSSSSSSSSSKTSNSSSASDKGSSGSKSSNSGNQSISNAEKSSGSNEGRSGANSVGSGASLSQLNDFRSGGSGSNEGRSGSYSADKIGASLSYEGGNSKNSPLSSSEKAELRDAILSSTSFSGTGPGASLEQLNEMVWMFGPGEQVWAPPLGGVSELPTGPIGFDPMNPAYPAGYGAPGAAPGTGWNPMQFLEDAMAEGERNRERRAAEGYSGSGAPVDLGALLWDLNAPYREREAAAGATPEPGVVDSMLFGSGYMTDEEKVRRMAWEGVNPDSPIDNFLWAMGLWSPPVEVPAAPGKEDRYLYDAPGTDTRWADLLDFAQRDARLAGDPGAYMPGGNSRMASADEVAALLAGEGAKYGKVGDQIGQTMGGIGDLLTAYAPGADIPLPRERPGYAPSAMDMAAIEAAQSGRTPIEITVPYGGKEPEDALRLPGQVEGALPQRAGGPEIKEPTIMDNIFGAAERVVSSQPVVNAVKTLFPGFYYSVGEGIKGGLDSFGAPQSNRPGDAFWEFQHQGSLSEPVDSGGGYYGGAPVVPPPVVPPFPDTNNNGIDDRLEGGGTTNEYDRFGQVVFPDMPPYNPGRDPEWLYFRKRAAQGMANGGIVGYADGGVVQPGVNPINMQDPRIEIIAAAEDALENAIEGQIEADDEASVAAFVEAFGIGALENLKANVQAGMKMRPGKGRLVSGPGGPKDDMVPAIVDGDQPVALSNGEYVLSADAVAGAGDGDPMAGAEALNELNARLAKRAA